MIPRDATAALYIVHSSPVAGVKYTQTGQEDEQWIMVIVVNYHVLCSKLCRILACGKLQPPITSHGSDLDLIHL
jgi:hypothetical protein